MPTPDHDTPYPQRWHILASVVVVLLMTPLDMSAVNVILPTLKAQFASSVGAVSWVSLAYLLVIVGLLLPFGRLGDLWGFRRLFLVGVGLFTVSSALCGLSHTVPALFGPAVLRQFGLPALIAARVLQGLGACMMMALSSGIITAVFPPRERGRAMGFVGMGIAFGLVLGPTLGGLLTQWFGWPWIFYINVPIGIAGGAWVRRMLPPLNPHHPTPVDWPGALLIIATLTTLMLGVTLVETEGWSSPAVRALLAASVAAGGVLVWHERRSRHPKLDFSLFANPVFAGANLAAMMNYLGQFTAIFITPFALRYGMNRDPQQIGLTMGVLPVAVLVLAPISGALSDRLGTRLLAALGEIIVAIGLFALALIIGRGQPLWIIPALALVGVGTGLFQSPNSSAIMGSLPRTHLGIGGSVLAVVRNLGMTFGIAISSAAVAIGSQWYHHTHPHASAASAILYAAHFGYLIGAAFALLGAVTSVVRQDQAKSPASS
jgi:EmrB/QacA subfamily drug resistance transporter